MACKCKLESLVRRLGLVTMLFGAVSVLFGIFDMYMISQPYNKDLATCGRFKNDGTFYYPCEGWKFSRLLGAIGVPLWAGKYFIATGSIAMRIQIHDNCQASQLLNKLKFTIFSRLAIAGAALVSPLLILSLVSELVMSPIGRGFRDDGFPILKWIIPMLAACNGTLLWLLCLVSAFVVCLKHQCPCLAGPGSSEIPSIQITGDVVDEDGKENKKSKRTEKRKPAEKPNRKSTNGGQTKLQNDVLYEEMVDVDHRRPSTVSDILIDEDIEIAKRHRQGKRRKSRKSAKKRESLLAVPDAGPGTGADDRSSKWEVRRNSGYAADLDAGKRRKPQRRSKQEMETDA